MLTGFQMQWVSLSEMSVQDRSHWLAVLAAPAFIPLPGHSHSVPQFSLYRKMIILFSLLNSSICTEDRTGYWNILRELQAYLLAFLTILIQLSTGLLFLKLACSPATTLSAAPFCLQAKVHAQPVIHDPPYFDLGLLVFIFHSSSATCCCIQNLLNDVCHKFTAPLPWTLLPTPIFPLSSSLPSAAPPYVWSFWSPLTWASMSDGLICCSVWIFNPCGKNITQTSRVMEVAFPRVGCRPLFWN